MAEENQVVESQKLKDKVAELERVVKAILEGWQNVYNETEEQYLPEGVYYGKKFEK